MSIQLQIILLATKLINVKKIFTLKEGKLWNEVTKRQLNVTSPDKNQFEGYQMYTIQDSDVNSYLYKKKIINY